MKASIYNALSDDEFRLKAFSDYCEDTQAAYQKLLLATSQAMDIVEDDPEDDVEYTQQYIESKVDEILQNNGINENNMLLFNDGYVSAKDYLNTVATGFVNSLTKDEDITETTVDLVNAANEVVDEYNVDELVNGIKTNLYSLTALCAANSAMLEDNVADRLQVYNDKLNTIFDTVYSSVSGTGTYLRQVITEKTTNIKSYLGDLVNLTAVNSIAADDSTSVPSESDIYAYTGSSPLCALNFSGTFQAIGTVINAGVKVVGAILVGAYNLAKGLFNKVANWLHEIAIDPKDIEEVNSNVDASYTVDGWCFNNDETGFQSYYNEANEYFDQHDAISIITPYLNQWIKFETIFCEELISPTSISKSSSTYSIQSKMRFKPKTINPDAVYESAKSVFGLTENTNSDGVKYITINPTQSYFTIEKVVEWLQAIKDNPEMYITTDASEKTLICSMQMSTILQQTLSQWAFLEMNTSIDDDTPDTSNFARLTIYDVSSFGSHYLSTITNLDFLRQATGWNSAMEKFDDDTAVLSLPSSSVTYDQICTSTVMYPQIGGFELISWALNRCNRADDPINYTFVPYRNGVENFRPSRFRIRTDAQNQKAFDNFVTIATVVVIVAVISIGAVVALKKISRNLYMKRTQEVGRMDNAMWQSNPGEQVLTKREKKKYIRLQKKLNGSKALSSGLQDVKETFSSVSSTISTVSEDVSGVLQIRQLIV